MRRAETVIRDALFGCGVDRAGKVEVPEIMALLRAEGYAIVRVPDIAFKGPHDTNGSMLITAAEKAESARYPVGGSNVGRAVAQVLREVAAAADSLTYGGVTGTWNGND